MPVPKFIRIGPTVKAGKRKTNKNTQFSNYSNISQDSHKKHGMKDATPSSNLQDTRNRDLQCLTSKIKSNTKTKPASDNE